MIRKDTAYALSYSLNEPYGSAKFSYRGEIVTRGPDGFYRVAGVKRMFFTFAGALASIDWVVR